MPQCLLYLNSVQPFPIQTAFLLKFDFFFFFKELAEKANTEKRLDIISIMVLQRQAGMHVFCPRKAGQPKPVSP